jgi:hypothetical protein
MIPAKGRVRAARVSARPLLLLGVARCPASETRFRQESPLPRQGRTGAAPRAAHLRSWPPSQGLRFPARTTPGPLGGSRACRVRRTPRPRPRRPGPGRPRREGRSPRQRRRAEARRRAPVPADRPSPSESAGSRPRHRRTPRVGDVSVSPGPIGGLPAAPSPPERRSHGSGFRPSPTESEERNRGRSGPQDAGRSWRRARRLLTPAPGRVSRTHVASSP